MNELVAKVEQWSKDKGLHESDPKSQFLKVCEEFGEIGAAMARDDFDMLQDAIGDTIVTLIILAQQHGTNVEECLEIAYNEIAGRRGVMIDGIFIKSEDYE